MSVTTLFFPLKTSKIEKEKSSFLAQEISIPPLVMILTPFESQQESKKFSHFIY
jgi:hypothetical protein